MYDYKTISNKTNHKFEQTTGKDQNSITPARRQLVVLASNHMSGRRRDQSGGWPETRGSAAKRG